MKQIDDLTSLVDFLKSQGLSIEPAVEERLQLYLEMLVSWSRKMNLVSSNDSGLLVNRHFLASFYYVNYLVDSFRKQQRLLDLGSGAGFPGIIVSIYFPEHRVYLIDSSRKKTLFLRKVKECLSLNCEITNDRAENLRSEKTPKFDFVLARAVASISRLSELAGPLLQKPGSLITIKGSDECVELDQNKYIVSSQQIDESWLKFSDYFEKKKLYKMELV